MSENTFPDSRVLSSDDAFSSDQQFTLFLITAAVIRDDDGFEWGHFVFSYMIERPP